MYRIPFLLLFIRSQNHLFSHTIKWPFMGLHSPEITLHLADQEDSLNVFFKRCVATHKWVIAESPVGRGYIHLHKC